MSRAVGFQMLHSRLSLRQFLIVSAIAETGSILNAARMLNMTQPAVSRALAELERIVGRPIFERTRRGTLPTSAGEVLIRHARATLSEMRAAWEGMEDVEKGRSGRITLGTLPNGVAGPLPGALAAMRRERPGVAITVVEGLFAPLISSLRSGEVDMVFGRLDHPDPAATAGLVGRPLYRQEWSVLARAGHPILERRGLKMADIVRDAWIVPVPGSPIRSVIEGFFLRQGLPLPSDRLEISGLGVSRAMLLECDLLICLPRGTYRTDTERGILGEVDVSLDGVNELVGLFRRAEARNTPAEALFEQLLARVCREMQLPGTDIYNRHS
jgi:DNA-binding transcriptional LysR family regulator